MVLMESYMNSPTENNPQADCSNSGLAKQSAVRGKGIRRLLTLAAIALMTLPATRLVNAQGLLYIVNTTSDTVVFGACENGNAGCSLRGAIEAANFHVGADGISIELPASSVINLTGALPDLSESVAITGPGAGLLTVRRDTGGEYRIFNVTTTGTVTFSGMTISNGLLDVGLGGGIMNSNTGTVNVISSTLSDNHTETGSGIGLGGAIFNFLGGTINVINSTLSGNTCGKGGAIYNNSTGPVNVINSTLSNNTASVSGGAVYNNGILNVTNSTISGNFAGCISGIFNNGSGSANVKSSIIALNKGERDERDVFGAFTSSGFNLIGKKDASSSFTQPTDQTGTIASPLDPKLDPDGLQDNGGPTQTIALLFSSPALDKGTSDGLTGSLTTDQRGTGFARTFDNPAITNAAGGDGADIGAFEVQTATPTPTPTPTPVPTTLGNISTRLRVETGDNVLIGGFIITGTQAKEVIVRAIGPSLPVVGALADPILELHDGAGALLARNDNWMNATNKQAIIESTVAPTNDLESAILRTLTPGTYTAIVRGVNNSTGIALVEAFDLDLAADSILANISTRGLVQTDDDVMIGGFIILGSAAQEVLVRAIGPSLPVAGALPNPTLELHDKDGVIIASNDDWRSDQEAAIIATTIPPADDAESAILMTLTPDAYTAIVRGKDNTTGVALVEAYQLDN